MHKFAWTRILRHRLVRHGASPDDLALADYWPWRQRGVLLPIKKTTQELTDSQDSRCAICGGHLFAVEARTLNAREWEKWGRPRHDHHERDAADPASGQG